MKKMILIGLLLVFLPVIVQAQVQAQIRAIWHDARSAHMMYTIPNTEINSLDFYVNNELIKNKKPNAVRDSVWLNNGFVSGETNNVRMTVNFKDGGKQEVEKELNLLEGTKDLDGDVRFLKYPGTGTIRASSEIIKKTRGALIKSINLFVRCDPQKMNGGFGVDLVYLPDGSGRAWSGSFSLSQFISQIDSVGWLAIKVPKEVAIKMADQEEFVLDLILGATIRGNIEIGAVDTELMLDVSLATPPTKPQEADISWKFTAPGNIQEARFVDLEVEVAQRQGETVILNPLLEGEALNFNELPPVENKARFVIPDLEVPDKGVIKVLLGIMYENTAGLSYELVIEATFGIELPTEFTLYQNYPNPFNPETTIEYELSEDAQVILKIYNMLGQEVRILVDENKSSGSYSIIWNGANEFGQPVAAGVYIYRMTAVSGEQRFSKVKKMTLLK